MVSPILIYDIAENKQLSPCLPYLPSPVSLPEQGHSRSMMSWRQNGKGRDYIQSVMLKVTPSQRSAHLILSVL